MHSQSHPMGITSRATPQWKTITEVTGVVGPFTGGFLKKIIIIR